LRGNCPHTSKKESVAIIMEAGAEKLRYLQGRALAVNADGETAEISLD
jgi:hypothetical protein